ncbi:MAG: InlB B-repeat-containing protein, partial [Faecalicoccus sp.]|nr:InlB B-repeat-containing protein [Faecalicoccus sp.]
MKKTLRVLSSAALASSILFTQAVPAFAKQVNFYPSELKLVETVSAVNVTYDKNCSDSVKVPDSQSAEAESTITISFETPVRDGYTFAGWSENKNASENDSLLHAGDSYTVKGNTKLYAIWVKDQAPAADETKPALETNEEPTVQETTVEVQEETQEESANEAVTFQLMLDTHGGSMSIDHVDSDEQGTVT